jgi:lipopolysaccharide transport system permease protein
MLMHPPSSPMTHPVAPRFVEIRPGKGLFDLELDAIWHYRELLSTLILRDIQAQYKQAALGVTWAIMQPLFAVIIFSIIFGHFARMPSDGVPYPVFTFAAVLPWTYFAAAVRRGATGLVADSELVRKVYFPRLIIPMAGVIGPMVDFFISFVVLIGVMLWFGVMPSWRLLAVPPLLGIAALLAFAVGLWLSPINVRFRDVQHTLPFMVQVWMYATPIVYAVSIVPAEWRSLFNLNPMVGVIEGFRWAVFGKGNPDAIAIGISVFVIGVLLIAGLVFFKRMERSFADLI